MDATLDLRTVPVDARPLRAAYPLVLPDGREIEFRLPNGDDQHAAAAWTGLTPDEKRARFLSRCVASGEILATSDCRALAAAIEALVPKAGLEFAAVCPECGIEFSQRLEPARWLIAELRRRFPRLERDVHLLSLHYHWPLRDVLALPRERRLGWVKLLVREIDRATALSASNQ
jgi:hypothetical protein